MLSVEDYGLMDEVMGTHGYGLLYDHFAMTGSLCISMISSISSRRNGVILNSGWDGKVRYGSSLIGSHCREVIIVYQNLQSGMKL